MSDIIILIYCCKQQIIQIGMCKMKFSIASRLDQRYAISVFWILETSLIASSRKPCVVIIFEKGFKSGKATTSTICLPSVCNLMIRWIWIATNPKFDYECSCASFIKALTLNPYVTSHEIYKSESNLMGRVNNSINEKIYSCNSIKTHLA